MLSRPSIAALAITLLAVACTTADDLTGPSPAPSAQLVANVGISCDVTTIPVAECQALASLYNATAGDAWTDRTNWGTDPNPCTWNGVVCTEGDHGFVQELLFVDNNLTGQIPASLSALTHVERILFGNNHLTGPIPASIGTLPLLEAFSVFSNALTGEIPAALGDLPSLERLDLSNNPLVGTIPPALGNLTHLTRLDLSNAQLTGTIPATLGNLSQLTWLALAGNSLTGALPASIGQLGQLEMLSLTFNELTGAIPASFGQLVALKELKISGNHFSGALPPELGNLVNLEHFTAGSNDFTGTIPASFANLTKLQYLTLTGSALTGTLPAFLGTLPLELLGLDDNAFTGGIPESLTAMPTLEQLRLDGNQLSGTVSLAFAALEGSLNGYCYLAPGNVGLTVPDAPEYHALDTNGDGRICGLFIGTAADVGEDAIDAIEELVPSVLNGGQANALTTKLQHAIDKASQGQYAVALNMINSFVTQLTDMVTNGTLTPAQAAPFLAQAQFLITEWTALL
ncbi:MAG: leucine-rich repeat domain-containing protein [Gemmatimonadota bacterium]